MPPLPRICTALLTSLLLSTATGCGDDGGGGGAAGAPATIPKLGEPCTSTCASGTVCENTGPFAGLCTTQCSNDAACSLLLGTSKCFGETVPRCGLPCSSDLQCPSGTHCAMAYGGEMVCLAGAPTGP
ncbi:MAG: hypothetical protein OEZ06_02030 [Myxococcales bacterium]|nr:hypothetical protein [Myxococcales bacterium]